MNIILINWRFEEPRGRMSETLDSEYIAHIGKILTVSLQRNVGLQIDLTDGEIVRSNLRAYFKIRAVDAMEWILKCVTSDMDFDQAMEDEIPILRRYYNEFIGESNWSENDSSMMMVLNKYNQIKAGKYGNFAFASQ